jgi:hypothetical protein
MLADRLRQVLKAEEILLEAPLVSNLNLLAGSGAFTFTRASAATYFDTNNILQSVTNDIPRFHPSLGLLLEVPKTNKFKNSAVGANQNMSLTYQSYYILSFYGTGTVTRQTSTGTFAASLTGTGMNTLAHVGMLTNTSTTWQFFVSGSVTNVQFELASSLEMPTSRIITGVAEASRAEEILSIQTAGNINSAAGSLSFDYDWGGSTNASYPDITLFESVTDASNYTKIKLQTTDPETRTLRFEKVVGGVTYLSTKDVSEIYSVSRTYNLKVTWGPLGMRAYIDNIGGTVNTNTLPLSLGTTLRLGSLCRGYFKKLKITA